MRRIGDSTAGHASRRPWTAPLDAPSHGGCDFLEDPALDARSAEPVWLPDTDHLVAVTPAIVDGGEPFSLWTLPGRKSLVHDGRRLLVRSTLGRRVLRLAVSLSLGDGMPFAYAVPAGSRGHAGFRAASELDATFAGTPAKARKATMTRTDLVHMRALVALDAEGAGGSERDIADLLFAPFREPESWNDSAVRAQVRYLLDHGRTYRDGGYRDLLYPKPHKRSSAEP